MASMLRVMVTDVALGFDTRIFVDKESVEAMDYIVDPSSMNYIVDSSSMDCLVVMTNLD
jgi:hypothetical protein